MCLSVVALTMARTRSSAVITLATGLRGRAVERSTLELGPRTEHEIRSMLENEAGAERWTSLDRSLRDIPDEGGGIAGLRPAATAKIPSEAG